MGDNFKVIENYLMVKMPEEVDHHQSIIISKMADEFIVNSKVKNIVFDFEETRFMDSSGIGVIMGDRKSVV